MISRKNLNLYVIILVLFFTLPLNGAYAVNKITSDEQPTVVGESAILMDVTSGQILYEKNARQRLYPASTTKILTALVALEKGKLNDVVEVSEAATKEEGSSIWLKPGEKITLENLLYALLMNSANDGAVAIAEHVGGGSVDNFINLLNSTAARLGAKYTHFTNPNGLPDNNHYTTAYDLALISREAMKNKEFAKIVGTKTKTIEREDPDAFKTLINHNRLLWKYPGAIGIKTGYTNVAQQCIVAGASKNDRELIAVVLKTSDYNIWNDPTDLLDYGFNNYDSQKLANHGERVGEIEIKYSKLKMPVLIANDYYYDFAVNDLPKVTKQKAYYPNLTAPIKKGTVIGELIFYDGQHKLGSVNLTAGDNIARPFTTTWLFRSEVLGGVFLLAYVVYKWKKRYKLKRIKIKRF